MMQFSNYWLFAIACTLVALLMMRLVLSERVTLQGSLSFLALLALGISIGVFPGPTQWISFHLGFEVPSNFYFAVALGALGVLHISSLIMHSRVALRSITLTQEVAILQERLDRLQSELRARERQTS